MYAENRMTSKNQPVMLQLAPLPRTQIGPFLILGVDKDADRDTAEAQWAQRLIWARKGLTRSPLEDINWAREVMNSPEQRLRADAVSLNLDSTDGTLRNLRERFQGKRPSEVGARPLDVEKWLADYVPPAPVPTVEELRQNVRVPELPRDVPAVRVLLESFARAVVDPWQVDLDA
jgi:hypothetical protein